MTADRLALDGIGMTSRRTRERLIERLKTQGITDSQVLDVMVTTPRPMFVDEALAHRAYEDVSLPIGHGQTLSRPYTVAKMTELLLAYDPKKVLEIGTGSGYQTSVLAQCVPRVYTVERIRALQVKAQQRLRMLKLRNVFFKHDDGHLGWPEKGPFDVILSAAAASEVPQALIDQLADQGCLLTPVGGDKQSLIKVTKHDNQITKTVVEPAKFVPLLAGREP